MFEPVNALEHDLVRAAHEPTHRPAFLRELLDAEVFLALLPADGARITPDPHGNATIPAGMRLEIAPVEREGGPAMPVFTSPRRAQELYRQDHVVAPDRVRNVLARHPGTAFVLNPGSEYALDLSRDDAAALLRGEFTAH